MSGSGVCVSAERIGIWLRCLLDGNPIAAAHDLSALLQCCSIRDDGGDVFAGASSCRRNCRALVLLLAEAWAVAATSS